MQTSLSISHHKPDNLKPYAGNARTHSRAQISQIAKSIETFGFTNPVLINAEAQLLAGHGRVAAAKTLGLETIPAIIISHLTPNQQRALILADNKIAANAGWNEALLQFELSELAIEADNIDITITGFDMGEIDLIIGTAETLESETIDSEDIDAEALTPDYNAHTLTQLGDIWQLGDHRVLCGDSLSSES